MLASKSIRLYGSAKKRGRVQNCRETFERNLARSWEHGGSAPRILENTLTPNHKVQIHKTSAVYLA